MAACIAKEGMGFSSKEGMGFCGSGVREGGSGTSPSRGSRGELQMEGEALQHRWKCKRQLEGAEGGGGVRGWEVEEEEAERIHQQRQH